MGTQDAQQFRALSEKYIAQMKQSGISLVYDRDSVALLADSIDAERKGVSGEEASRWASFVGAYLGECIIRNFGGDWEYDQGKNEWGVRLGERTGLLYPMSKALNHITSGRGDSILRCFDSAAKRAEGERAAERGRERPTGPGFFERLLAGFRSSKD